MNYNYYSSHGIKNIHYSKQKYKRIHEVFILLIILINFKFASTQNATTCFELYSNRTIQQNCLNTTACCFLEYSYYNNTYTKCIEKLNESEDICSGINDIAGKEGASLSYCSCFCNFLVINVFILLIAFVSYI